MRRVHLLLAVLVVSNLVAFAWWSGWARPWLAPPGGSPVDRQVAPERVQTVPLARFEAARRPAPAGACYLFAAPEPQALERLAAWVRARAGVVDGEAVPAGYRVTFRPAPSPADLKPQLAELGALAGREPAPCPN